MGACKDVVSGTLVVAPAMPGEAVWLGFQVIHPGSRVTLRVRMNGRQHIDAITGESWTENLSDKPQNFLHCPPETRLVGGPVTGGRRLFGSDPGEQLTVFLWGSTPIGVSVHFLPPAEFAHISGRKLDPLDAADAYSGSRLP